MNIDIILSRLEKVKSRGANSWLAACPAHADRTPSLSVTVAPDGKILMKCFAECSIESICDALGIRLSDIMPERLLCSGPLTSPNGHRIKGTPADARIALEALAYQSMIVAVAAADMCRAKPLSVEDKDKLFEIAANINRTLENVIGRTRA